jgi:hypothetical protein
MQGPGGMPAGYPRPGGSGGMANYPGASGGGGQPGGGGGGMPQGYPGMASGGGPNRMEEMMKRSQGMGPGGQGGRPPGYPGAPGSQGGPGANYPGMQANQGGPGGGQDNGPADNHSPENAVRMFLKALKDKDKDKLAEATALRAQTEGSREALKDLFGRILDTSISDSELDDLAQKLDGYKVSGTNAVHSTGRLGVIVRKTLDKGGYMTRTITVRKEKKGWGVMDITNPYLFKTPSFSGMRKSQQQTGSGNNR